MRSLARLGPAVLGLALAVPAVGQAQTPGAQPAPTPLRHSNSIFKRCMCPECQRARVKAKDGVDVPPPPGNPPEFVSVPRRRFGKASPDCVTCEGGVVSGPFVMADGSQATGRAVVGGGGAPGYAVVEPSPVGVVSGPAANGSRMKVAGRKGKKDAAVAPTDFRAASDPIGGAGHNPPHVIRHLFGLDAIGKRSVEERERRHREKHASIAYGPQKVQPVTDLPASVVDKFSR